jgi:hypothetical protein
MTDEKLIVLSYLEITSCNNNKLESNIVEIRKAVEDNAAITKDTLMKTFLTKIIDQNFHATRLRLIQRKSGENSPLSSDSNGESSLDHLSYGTEQWMSIICDRQRMHIVWDNTFPEIFTGKFNYDEEIDNLTGIVLYITN